jgi:hypothetical protein
MLYVRSEQYSSTSGYWVLEGAEEATMGTIPAVSTREVGCLCRSSRAGGVSRVRRLCRLRSLCITRSTGTYGLEHTHPLGPNSCRRIRLSSLEKKEGVGGRRRVSLRRGVRSRWE